MEEIDFQLTAFTKNHCFGNLFGNESNKFWPAIVMTESCNFKHCKYYELDRKLIKVNERNSSDFHHPLCLAAKGFRVKPKYVTTIGSYVMIYGAYCDEMLFPPSQV